MTNKLANRVKVIVSGTPGTGAITLGEAVAGFQSFAAGGISNNDTVPYVIEDGAAWEIGVGTYSSTGPTLTRTSITASSNSGSAINASSNSIVMLSPLAADLQSGTAAGNLVELDSSARIPAVDGSLVTNLNVGNAASGTLAVARGGTGLTSLTAGQIPFGNGTSAFGSSSNLFWDSANGRLGVGLSNPTANLDVAGNFYLRGASSAGAVFEIGADATSGSNGCTFEAGFASGGYGPIQFRTGGSERLRIDSSGRVGIGNATLAGFALRLGTPLTGATNAYCFHNGAQIQSDVTSNVFFMNSQPSTAAASFTLTNLYHFNVVNASLGAGSSITNQYGVSIPDLTSGSSTNIGVVSSVSSGTGRWNFYANGTADNYFNGKVGIGTANPRPKLEVSGPSVSVAFTDTSGSTDNKTWDIFTNAGSWNLRLINDAFTTAGTAYAVARSGNSTTAHVWYAGATVEAMRLNSSGNLGIGTSSPAHRVHAVGASAQMNIQDTSGAGAVFLLTRGTGAFPASGAAGFSQFNGSLFIKNLDTGATIFTNTSSDTERMRITNAGNVGIGTTAPTALLDVNSNKIRVRTAKTPSSATDTGDAGDVCWDSSYIYVCTATNTWKRAAIATW